MKRILYCFLVLVLGSCNHETRETTDHPTEEISKGTTETTNNIVSSTSGSTSNTTYTLTSTAGGATSSFKGEWALSWSSAASVNANFHFEKSGNKINDALNTQMFSKYLDLNDVKDIQIDSMAYKMIDETIKLKFIISFIRNQKITEKYTLVYRSSFNDPKPTIVLDKVTKTSVEIFGNTY